MIDDHPWPDDDLLPPLDIDRAAIAILQEMGRIYDHGVSDETRQAVIRVLTAYDTGRTEYIKFLKQELIRMHNLYPQPGFILKPKA